MTTWHGADSKPLPSFLFHETNMSFSNTPMLAILLAAVMTPTAWAHGYIGTPIARQLCNGKETQYSVSVSGGNGGRGRTPPLGGMPGLCGDPFQAHDDKDLSNIAGKPCAPQVWFKL
jgi:hypothetical protein